MTVISAPQRATCWAISGSPRWPQILHHTITLTLAASACPKVIGSDPCFRRSLAIIGPMPFDLTDDDRADLARFLREAIEADSYPLSPRVRRLKALLAKIDPLHAPAVTPLPPPKPPGQPSMVLAKKRRR